MPGSHDFIGRLARWRRRRAAIRELQALNDHHLSDIGLDRATIVSSVDAVFRTRPRRAASSKTVAHSAVSGEYRLGVVLVLIAAVTYSTAGLFTKGVDAGSWEIIFWRGVFAAAFTTAWTAGRGVLRQNFLGMGRGGLAVGIVGALGTAAFIPAFKLTSIANVSMIYAVSPLVAALLAWLAIGERASTRTLIGSVGALLGVAVIVSGSLGQLSLTGDLLALWMTTAMATIMVIYRKFPETPGAGPAVLQSLLLLPPAVLLGAPFTIERMEIAVLGVFGLLFAIASVALAEGSKRVPSGQTALLGTLETPLAPILAFALLAEIPNRATFMGGCLVLFAVLFTMERTPRADR